MRVFSSNGIEVYSTALDYPGADVFPLPNQCGVVLGQLFPVNGVSAVPGWTPTISEHEAESYTKSPALFCSRYWGGYLAFFRDRDGKNFKVVRDCSGKLVCYRTEYRGTHILFSHLPDVQKIGLCELRIDWDYLASFLHACDIQTRATAYREVTELLAGDIVEIECGRAIQYSLWDPRIFATSLTTIHARDAAALLRDTTQSCVESWASAFRRITLRLSGGFDSAVVLGTLKLCPNPPDVTCTNQFSSYIGDDERLYARAAAEAARVPLLELERPQTGVQFNSSSIASQIYPRPDIQALFGTLDFETNSRIAAQVGAQAAWTGQGGDHLFYQARTTLGASDFVFQNGMIHRGLPKVVAETARLSKHPYISVFLETLRQYRDETNWNVESVVNRKNETVNFLRRHVSAEEFRKRTMHPWMDKLNSVPKGKRLQIFTLTELLNRHRPIPNAEPIDEVHPLISQPLIELCLNLPTYILLDGGRSRGLARSAFADRVPRSIIQREDKGDTMPVIMDTVRGSEQFLKATLFSGILADRKIIEPSNLKPYIVDGQSIKIEHLWPLLSCIAVELWVRAQMASSAVAAA